MLFLKNNSHATMKKALGILLLIFAGLLLVGCSTNDTAEDNEADAEKTVDKSEQAIRTVIEKEFDGPDEQYKELRDAAMEAQISDKYIDDYEAFGESPEYQELMGYMEETYASYFTENGYNRFINETPAFLYSGFEHNYKLTTSDIEITQNENNTNIYKFTFRVEYTVDNKESNHFNFEGEAFGSEEGKIGKIEYLDGYEDGLLQELRNNE